MNDKKIDSYLNSDDRKLFLNSIENNDLDTVRFLNKNSDMDYITLMNLDMIANTDYDYDMFGIVVIFDKNISILENKVNGIPLFEYYKNDKKHNNSKIIRYLRNIIVDNNISRVKYDENKLNDIYKVLTIKKDNNKRLIKDSTN